MIGLCRNYGWELGLNKWDLIKEEKQISIIARVLDLGKMCGVQKDLLQRIVGVRGGRENGTAEDIAQHEQKTVEQVKALISALKNASSSIAK